MADIHSAVGNAIIRDTAGWDLVAVKKVLYIGKDDFVMFDKDFVITQVGNLKNALAQKETDILVADTRQVPLTDNDLALLRPLLRRFGYLYIICDKAKAALVKASLKKKNYVLPKSLAFRDPAVGIIFTRRGRECMPPR